MKIIINKWYLLIFILLFSCKQNSYRQKPNIDKIQLDIKVIRFDNDLFSIPQDELEQQLPRLEKDYGLFFDLYSENIISIGNVKDNGYASNLLMFLNNETVKIAREKVVQVFNEDKEIEEELKKAFKYFRYYFPDKNIPKIYTYISGFNQSLMLADDFIGIGLDKYLGTDYDIYSKLGIYKYLTRNMKKEKIVSDCMRAWAIGEWPLDYNNVNLISKMIYEGKLLYFCTQMLPEQTDSLIVGFTKDQMKWCINNEKQMWVTLIEEKLLFTNNHITINKLTEDAPYTSIFPAESPGKACNWIGFRIVDQYMKKNRNVTLKDLMENTNYQLILEKAKYKPRR